MKEIKCPICRKKYNINPYDINRGLISERFGYSKEQVDSITYLWNNYRINGINDFLHKVNKYFSSSSELLLVTDFIINVRLNINVKI